MLYFVAFKKIFCLDWDVFLITGGSRVHFPRASPVPLCDVCNTQSKLQALVHDILSPTSAIIGYAVGLQKLSAKKQFFFGAQMTASLKQTAQITPGVSFFNHPHCLQHHK